MLQKIPLTTSWGIGLTDAQVDFLRATLGEEHELILFSIEKARQGEYPALPFLIWASGDGCALLDQLPEGVARYVDAAPKVFLLDQGYTLADFEAACDHGFTEILRPLFSREQIACIVRRALEAHSLHHDMECMTREILLERELLERKNELLDFLAHFLAHSTESLEIGALLQNAYQGLEKLLPLRAIHAALWEHEEGEPPSISLYSCAPRASKAGELWRELLLDEARRAVGGVFSVSDCQRLRLSGQPEDWAAALPQDGALLNLPLVCGAERMGVLLALTSMERHLGKDQATALDSAMRHFSLSVKNARRFRQMQMYADYDGLTRVHSRRHFEERLEEERHRVDRYGQPLSMLMLDIDHFKQVNDSRGHHAGDRVLREVAAVIASNIRSADYCARYGGEEFAVLMPHTDSKKAFVLAERIRKAIAAHIFLEDCAPPLHVTISIGAASMASSEKSKQALVCEADAGLYAAKQEGRNRTCMAPKSALLTPAKRNVVG